MPPAVGRRWRATLLAAVLGSALPGCATERPFYRQDAPVVPPDLLLTTDDGAKLPVRVWRPPGRARAAVLALHGFTDSRDAWEQVGPLFARQGIALYAIDQRGFGAAPGRGHWAGTDRMLEDAAEAAAAVQAREPGAPLYLMGESMGGAEVLCLAADDRLARHGVHAAGGIALAPAVWGAGQMNLLTTVSLDSTDLVAPGWVLTGRMLPFRVRATDDRAALIRLARDPLTLIGTRVSMLKGLVGLMTRAQGAAGGVRLPLLVAYGGRDELVPAAATAAAWSKLPPTTRRAFYANGFHLMMRDLDKAAVEDDVLSWIEAPDRPLPSGADVLAAGWWASRPWEGHAPAALPAAWEGFTDTATGDDPR